MIAFLARADVALSVAMTAASTLLAVIMTPSLTAILAGSRIEVPAAGLLLSTLQVVVLPLAMGGLLKRWLPGLTAKLLPVAPLAAPTCDGAAVSEKNGEPGPPAVSEKEREAGPPAPVASV